MSKLKTHNFTLRLTESDWQILKSQAEDNGLVAGEYARMIIVNALKREARNKRKMMSE